MVTKAYTQEKTGSLPVIVIILYEIMYSVVLNRIDF